MDTKTRRKKGPSGRTKAAPSKKAAPKKSGPRADLGEPIDGFFAKQPPHLRAILEELRLMVEDAAPDAVSSLKWGMPWFTVNGNMMCSLGGHKAHVNLVLMGPAVAFDDPDGRLSGTGANGRHLKLTALDELPRAAVRRWLPVAAKHARGGG